MRTTHLWNMGCIFQKYDRILDKKVVPKHTDNISYSYTGVGQHVGHPNSQEHHCTAYAKQTCIHVFFCWHSPHHIQNGVTQMCIRAQPFSTNHGKICSNHVIFIPTWMAKRAQDLDLRNDADCQLLSYGAYVYALGCHLIDSVQWVIPSWPTTWKS